MSGNNAFYEERMNDLRCTLPSLRTAHEPKRLWDRHHQIIRLIVMGLQNKEIAEYCNCSPQLVSNIRNSQAAQGRIQELRDNLDNQVLSIQEKIKEGAEKAIDLVLKAMNEGEIDDVPVSVSQRISIAQNLLDRAGHGATQKGQVQHLHAHLTSTDIEGIKKRALEVGMENGHIIDVEEERE